MLPKFARFVLWLGVGLFIVACSSDSASLTKPAISAESGSMSLASPSGSADASEQTSVPTPVVVLQPGADVVSITGVRVYAAPERRGLAMAEYPPGAAFTVVEPDGDFGAYPVLVDDVRWVRLRAEDGLVGWTYVAALTEQR